MAPFLGWLPDCKRAVRVIALDVNNEPQSCGSLNRYAVRMSAHFHKLKCGPRSLMILAAKLGRPIDPDALWERFAHDIEQSTAAPGAVSVSTLLDMARAFRIAQRLDVTHDVDRAGQALATKNVAGVLMTWERFPTSPGGGEFAACYHIVVAHRVMVGGDQ